MIPLLFFMLSLNMSLQAGMNSSNVQEADLENVYDLMQGFYSSESQASADTNYFHVNLCMIPLWENSEEVSKWLYVEQSLATMPDKPYRQRVYELFISDDQKSVISKVWEIESPEEFVGACTNIEKLASLEKKHLIIRPGCELFLTPTSNGSFEGETIAGDCITSARGAQYVSSHVVLTSDRLISWDRGWSEDGEHIWGPESGGYIFDRIR